MTSITPMVGRSSLDFGVVAIGATAMGAQIVILRECLSLAYGNELIIGLALGSWLFLTGIGAYVARWFVLRQYAILAALGVLVLSSLLPVLTLMAAITLRMKIFPPGTMLDLSSIFLGFMVLLFPFCATSGAGFVLFTGAMAQQQEHGSSPGLLGRVYGLEAVGSFLGGLLASFGILLHLSSLDVLLFLMLVGLGLVFWIAQRQRLRVLMGMIGMVSVCAITGRVVYNPDWVMRKHLFAGQELLEYWNTPHGALAVTRYGEQINVFQNNVLVGSTDDIVSREEPVHYAMAQRMRARDVLVVAGTVSGILHEVLKYPSAHIDLLEIEPALIDVATRYADGIPTKRVNVIVVDAPLFLRRTETRYDVVMLNLPDPATIQINRHYSVEFFQNVKQRLTREGVLSWSISSSADYLGEEARKTRSVLFATAKSVFRNVTIVPGQRDYFLASDGILTLDIADSVAASGIPTVYVNKWYINDARLKERSAEILQSIDYDAPLNSDFSPVSTWWQLKFWLRYFDTPLMLPMAIILAGLLFIAIRPGLLSAGMFAIGFGGMTLEMALLLGFQMICGYLYQMIGLLLTLFMGGLAVGTYVALRQGKGPTLQTFALATVSIALIAFLLPSALGWIRRVGLPDAAVYTFFVLSMTGVAMLVGYAFAIAGRLETRSPTTVASELYASDVAGSAAGAFFVSAFLIPWFGLKWTSWIAGFLLLGLACLILLATRIHKR